MPKDTHIIEVKTKGAKKSQKQIKGVGGALGGMAKQAGIAAAAYFGTRALLNGIKSSIDLFGRQELAEKKLQAALGRTSPALLKQARALQQVSMFGDEVVMEAQAMIASFVKDEKAIKAATIATLDLAAAKGFDLVAAADLVSKTLGSSTNALTRYGIEVTGAVGSTERLTSLTENIATVFGGQATEQADTYAGSMAQLSNAFGDLQEDIGEKLAPTLGNLAKKLKDLITIPVSEQLQEEHDNFVNLTNALLDVNTSETTRKRIITELQTLYPDYIGNLDLEKASMEDIRDMTEDANQAMKDKIVTQTFAEQLSDINQRMSKETARLFEIETKSVHGASFMWRDFLDIWRGAEGTGVKIKGLHDIISDAQIERIEGLAAELEELERNRAEFELWLQSRLDGEASLNGEDGEDGNMESKLEGQALFNEQQLAEVENINKLLEKQKEQKRMTEEFIKLYPKQAKSLGMVSDAEKKRGDLMKMLAGQYKAVQLSQIIGDTFTAARAQFKEFSKAYPAPTGQILGAAAYAATIAQGYSDFSAVQGAQYGADFVTDGPQMMLVGEGSGAEHVQVTPLVDENISGPQGGGITLNISGNVMSEEYTEEVIIPQIKEGLRLGGDIGVN